MPQVGGPGTFPKALEVESAAGTLSVCVLQLRFFEREDTEKGEKKERGKEENVLRWGAVRK